MAAPEGRAFRRVIVALDAFARDAASIESAAALAARLHAEIAGLFVEDIDLLHLAGLPCARQVSLLTAAEELFDLGTLERELRVIAEHAQARISAAAARCRVHWSFRTVRGKIEAELLAATQASDLLVVVPPQRAAAAPAGSGDGWSSARLARSCSCLRSLRSASICSSTSTAREPPSGHSRSRAAWPTPAAGCRA
jgi:hypothetical protein